MTACSLQKEGSRSNAVKISTEGRRRLAGMRNPPAGITRALVIVVFGSLRLARLSHGAARVGAGEHATMASSSKIGMCLLIAMIMRAAWNSS
jgi:hypothetical protein